MAVRPDMMLLPDCRRESGVRTVETILTLLVLTTALAFLARKVNVPYPIFLVVAGMGLAFVPSLPAVTLDPQLVFLLFLPPILYAAGYFTSWRDFRTNLFSIRSWPWASSSRRRRPSRRRSMRSSRNRVARGPRARRDRLAAGRDRRHRHRAAASAPRQIVTILEGESLVNDATGLVIRSSRRPPS